jgi:hypothetical protein
VWLKIKNPNAPPQLALQVERFEHLVIGRLREIDAHGDPSS